MSAKTGAECPRKQKDTGLLGVQLGTPATCESERWKTGQHDGEIRVKSNLGEKKCGEEGDQKPEKKPLILYNAKQECSGSI